jgi:nucleoid-associated protein YgaU
VDDTMTEEFEEHEARTRRPQQGRVLWGRFAFWGVMLLLMFGIGRVSDSDDTHLEVLRLEQQVTELAEQNQELRNEIEARQAGGTNDAVEPEETAAPQPPAQEGEEVEAAPEADAADGEPDAEPSSGVAVADESAAAAQPAPEEASPEEATPVEPADEDEAGEEPDARTYTVLQGDTLHDISQRMYGDPQQSTLIAEANGLTRDTPLQVGQELRIPPGQ